MPMDSVEHLPSEFTPSDTLPATLQINAWDSGPVRSNTTDLEKRVGWAFRAPPANARERLQATAPDPSDWKDPRVGWGLILPMPASSATAVELAKLDDQPQAIRDLIAARTINGKAPSVFRYDPTRTDAMLALFDPVTGHPLSIDGSGEGTGPAQIPRYLLIYGSPAQIPWDLQYQLNARCAVGRIDLAGDELRRYVDALINDWSTSALDVTRVVIWAVDFGANDITNLMRRAIAERIKRSFASDGDVTAAKGLRYIDGSAEVATGATLCDALRPPAGKNGPAVIVTTSHGLTDTSSPNALAEGLGLLVGSDQKALSMDDLLSSWQPAGAIWYAHACCSAGSGDMSVFSGLVSDDSKVQQVLDDVTNLAKTAGAQIAPLPRRLLGAAQPLRAFIGHVEPTFDWTLQAESGQYLTDALRAALYDQLYSGKPVGEALRQWYLRLATSRGELDRARAGVNAGTSPGGSALRARLANQDVRSLVILGDPTVRIPFSH